MHVQGNVHHVVSYCLHDLRRTLVWKVMAKDIPENTFPSLVAVVKNYVLDHLSQISSIGRLVKGYP